MTFYNGATSQIRTGDPRITSAMLWPAELKWQNLVTPTGIEPMSPPWKGDVLTAWPRGHKISNASIWYLVSYPRLERGTTWLKVKCSTTWANSPYTWRVFQRLYILLHFFINVNKFVKKFCPFCYSSVINFNKHS